MDDIGVILQQQGEILVEVVNCEIVVRVFFFIFDVVDCLLFEPLGLWAEAGSVASSVGGDDIFGVMQNR